MSISWVEGRCDRAVGNTGSTPAERSLLSLEMGPDFPGGDTGQGPLREPIAQALKGERGRRVRDRRGRGAEQRGGRWGTDLGAEAGSQGPADVWALSIPRHLVLGFQEPHTCSLSQEGPPCSVSIADPQTFTHPPSCTHLTKSSGAWIHRRDQKQKTPAEGLTTDTRGDGPFATGGVCQNVEAGLLELTDDPGRGSWRVTVPSGLGRGCHGDKWPGSDSCMGEWGVEAWTDWIWIRTSNCDQTRESEAWRREQTESESEQDQQLQLMHGRVRRGHVDRLSLYQNQQAERFCVGRCLLCHWAESESESEVTQSCPTPSDPMDCSLPRSSVHGIFQARVLEWVAVL